MWVEVGDVSDRGTNCIQEGVRNTLMRFEELS